MTKPLSGNKIKKYKHKLTEKVLYSCLPEGFKFKRKPFWHQLLSVVFGLQFGSTGFFHEMGCGKSQSSIDLIRALGVKDKIVVLTMKSLIKNWENEFKMNSDYSVKCFTDGLTKVERDEVLQENKYDVFIMNFESTFYSGKKKKGKKFKMLKGLQGNWNVLIVDESRLCKNSNAIRTKVAMALAHNTKFRIILSGLPIAKSIEEIYAQHYIVDLGKQFGTSINDFYWDYFNKRFNGFGNIWEPKRSSEEKVTKKMFKQCLRFSKEECLDLPEKVYQIRKLNLEGDQKSFYDTLKNKKKDVVITKKNKAVLINAELRKFHQICGGWVIITDEDENKEIKSFTSNVKLKELEYLLTEELSKEQVIIFAAYRAEQKGVYEFLKKLKIPVGQIVSGMSSDEVDSEIKKFNDKKSQVLVCSLKVGGRGLNLTAATYMIYYSLDFDYEVVRQSEDRIHRIGQTKKCTYIYLIGEKTVDERVYEVLQGNKRLVDAVVEGTKLIDFI